MGIEFGAIPPKHVGLRAEAKIADSPGIFAAQGCGVVSPEKYFLQVAITARNSLAWSIPDLLACP